MTLTEFGYYPQWVLDTITVTIMCLGIAFIVVPAELHNRGRNVAAIVTMSAGVAFLGFMAGIATVSAIYLPVN
jgi:hypothetical protein